MTPSQVKKLLQKVNVSKATGLDNISNRILKIAAPVIYQQLTDIFNLSIKLNVFPTDWKKAKVLPVFKSGERDDPGNYRPISVLPTIVRLFERLIYNQFYSYLVNQKLLNPRQSGFRTLHSTVTALLDLNNDWCFNIDRGMINGVILIDLKKAFDTVDHELVLKKLRCFGVLPESLEWFKSYLSSRTQQCYVNGVISEQKPITCGVPQGSILGPLLFLIYINDLTTCTEYGTTRMYADDTNLTYSACSVDELQRQMGKDLEKLSTWLAVNKLTLNILKTEYMLIGSRQRISTLNEVLNLSVNGVTLQQVKNAKCLGVTIDEFLTWETHLTNVIRKVSAGIGVLRRVKKIVPRDNLISIYRSIIEPYFDYCCLVWDGIGTSLAERLQKLQNRAARVITSATYLKRSKDIRSELGWQTLQERRNKLKAVMMFKTLNGMAPRYMEDIFNVHTGNLAYNLRASCKDVALPQVKTDYYRKSFAFTGAKLWNSLPNNLKEENSLEAFVKKLNHVDPSVIT